MDFVNGGSEQALCYWWQWARTLLMVAPSMHFVICANEDALCLLWHRACTLLLVAMSMHFIVLSAVVVCEVYFRELAFIMTRCQLLRNLPVL